MYEVCSFDIIHLERYLMVILGDFIANLNKVTTILTIIFLYFVYNKFPSYLQHLKYCPS